MKKLTYFTISLAAIGLTGLMFQKLSPKPLYTLAKTSSCPSCKKKL